MSEIENREMGEIQDKLAVLERAVVTLFNTSENPKVLAESWGKIVAEYKRGAQVPPPGNATEVGIAESRAKRYRVALALEAHIKRTA